MDCPTPKDMSCPIPPILWGGTWYVLCPVIARDSRMVQVYLSAVMLLIRRTKAIGGNVERGCFGVPLRYTARGGAGWRGAGPRGGADGEGAQGGRGGAGRHGVHGARERR